MEIAGANCDLGMKIFLLHQKRLKNKKFLWLWAHRTLDR
jgi:hypothetical protein